MEKNLGHATAYGYAKSKGYTGTEEEFGVLMASYATVAQQAAQSAQSAAQYAGEARSYTENLHFTDDGEGAVTISIGG